MMNLSKYRSKPVSWWLQTPLYAWRFVRAKLGKPVDIVRKPLGIVRKRVFGYQMQLECAEHIQGAIACDSYERVETAWVRDYLRLGMTFVDVGANVGYFSLLAARCVGENGRVIAFEPSPQMTRHFEKTIESNKISQIRLEKFALGDCVELLPLRLQRHCLHSPSLTGDGEIALGTVPLMPLDDYLEQAGIKTLDLVKIDVEGWEPNVVRGMQNALRNRRVQRILCELNEGWLIHNNSSADELHQLILSFGFTVEKSNDCGAHQNILYKI